MRKIKIPRVYVPPVVAAAAAEVPAVLGQRDDVETFTGTYSLVSLSQAPVYATTRRWAACDVYVIPQPGPGVTTLSGVISIFVYAITGQTRALVATGRYAIDPYNTGTINALAPRWVCAARAVASRFEVVASWDQVAALGNQGDSQFTVTIAASDYASQPPIDIGLEPLNHLCGSSDLSQVGANGVGTYQAGQIEVISLTGIPGAAVAAARWLHVFDTTTGALNPPVGEVPIAVFPIGAVAGVGGGVFPFRYRTKFKLRLLASSTPTTLTAAVDCIVGGMGR